MFEEIGIIVWNRWHHISMSRLFGGAPDTIRSTIEKLKDFRLWNSASGISFSQFLGQIVRFELFFQ